LFASWGDFQPPEAGLESPANRQAEKPALWGIWLKKARSEGIFSGLQPGYWTTMCR
jgi:hypothetical protein